MGMQDWLKDESNQKLLKFLGGAVVAIAAAGWTAYSTLFPKDPPKPAAPIAASAVVSVPVASPPVSAVQNSTTDGGIINNISGNNNQTTNTVNNTNIHNGASK